MNDVLYAALFRGHRRRVLRRRRYRPGPPALREVRAMREDALYIAAGALLVLLSCFIVILGAAFVVRIVVESWPC